LDFLATWRERDQLAKLVNSMLGTSGQDILYYGEEYIEEEDKKMVANITQFLCKVSYEQFTLVVNVID